MRTVHRNQSGNVDLYQGHVRGKFEEPIDLSTINNRNEISQITESTVSKNVYLFEFAELNESISFFMVFSSYSYGYNQSREVNVTIFYC